jgi:uncharacterized protein YlzI (FlbEa/FlbD family)
MTRWIKLTRPDGENVYVASKHITAVEKDAGTGYTMILFVSGKAHTVKESVPEVMRRV